MQESYEQPIADTDTSTRGKTPTGEKTVIESAARASTTADDSTRQLGGSTSVSPERKGIA